MTVSWTAGVSWLVTSAVRHIDAEEPMFDFLPTPESIIFLSL